LSAVRWRVWFIGRALSSDRMIRTWIVIIILVLHSIRRLAR